MCEDRDSVSYHRVMPGPNLALLGLGMRNLRSQAGLVGATVAIAALIVALTAAVPLFARAVSGDLFAVSTAGADRAEVRIAWNGSVHGPTSWTELSAVDDDLRARAGRGLVLPDGRIRSLVDSVRFQVRVPDAGPEAVGSTSLSWHDDLRELARITDGTFPDASFAPGGRIEVAVEAQTAALQGIGVGTDLTLALRSTEVSIPATVVGLWVADDPDGWVTAPDLLADRYFTDRAALERIFGIGGNGQEPDAVRSARWLVSSSAADLTAAEAPAVRSEAAGLVRAATDLVPELESDTRLATQLDRFLEDTVSMRRQMVVVMAPVLAALAFFTLLLGRQRAATRRREFDLWRLRGAAERQVTTVVMVEAVAMALLATVIGLLAAPLLARLLGSFDGFLDPSARIGRTVWFTRPAAAVGVATGLVVLVALLAASVRMQREVVTSLTVLGAAVVALLAVVLATAPTEVDGFRDPAPFVVPVLVAALAVGVGALGLVNAGRFVRPRMVDATTGAASIGLAVRRLGTSRWMAGPAALLAVGVAVALTSAAVGRSTDQHLEETVRHDVGADWVIQESLAVRLLGAGDGGLRADPMTSAQWREVDGVEAATRVGEWTGSVGPPGRAATDMTLLAIDPDTFSSVAWWRDDYADEPLATLMDRLRDGGVLASPGAGLTVGATAEVRVFTGTDSRVFEAPVVGRLTAAPTWSSDASPAVIVAPFDTIASLVGDARGFETWLSAGDGFERSAREATFVAAVESAGERIDAIRQDPVRRGVHGVLSFAAVLLLGLGLLGGVVAVLFADRARAGERSLLRAIGFPPRRLGAAAVLEASLVLVPAMLGGALIGLAVTATLLGGLIGVGTGTPGLRLVSDLRLLPVLAVGALAAGLVSHVVVARRAAAPLDLHSFANEGES